MLHRAVMAIAVLTLVAATALTQTTRSSRGTLGGATPATAGDAWAQARFAVGDQQRWVPGSSSVTIELLSRNGETDRTIVLDHRITEAGDDLVLTVTPVSASTGGGGLPMPPGTASGGEPVPAPNSRMGRMLSQGDGEGGGAQSQTPANPFAPAVADSVTLSDTGASRSIGGVRAREYGIEWSDPDGSTYSGSVWLDADTSAPIRLNVTGDMAEADIREFHSTISYEGAEGVILPARSITRASRRINLFSTVRTRVTVSYGDYFETDGTREIVLGRIAGREE